MPKKDDELIIMGRLWRTLDGMNPDARGRVVDYLVSRHEEKLNRETTGEPVEFQSEKKS